jgi:hypothetical protein
MKKTSILIIILVAIVQMAFLKNNVSFNKEKGINLISLQKTAFAQCEDPVFDDCEEDMEGAMLTWQASTGCYWCEPDSDPDACCCCDDECCPPSC